MYVSQMIIGNTDIVGYDYGEKSQYYVLISLFFISTFIIILHFLNMLIAIMGNTYAERREVGELTMVKDHLRFVMDNWLLMNIAFRDKERLKYIVCAFQANDDDAESEIPEIKEKLSEISLNLRN